MATAVVVGSAATAAIVIATHDKPKKPKATAEVLPRVELASCTRPISGLDLRGARYVRVTGARGAAVQRGINDALRGPLEWSIGEMKRWTDQADPPCTKPTVVGARPEIGLRGPRLLSAQPAKPAWGQAPGCTTRAPMQRKDFYPGEPLATSRPTPPTVSPFFTPQGMAMMWTHTGSECIYFSVTLPYSQSRDLLNPRIAAMLPR